MSGKSNPLPDFLEIAFASCARIQPVTHGPELLAVKQNHASSHHIRCSIIIERWIGRLQPAIVVMYRSNAFVREEYLE
jgi:hypothetical protein